MTHPWRSYVALGDSFTEGLEDHYPDGEPRGWADRLAQTLADRCGEDVRYANLAIRGRLLGPILAEQLEPAIALRPDLVSLVGGGNDLLRPSADPDVMAADLDAAVTRLRKAGIDVLLGTGVDTRDAGLLSMTRKKTAVFNTNLFTIAQRQGVHILNLWGLRSLHDWQVWADDRLHLNDLGHERACQAALVGLGLPPDRPDWDEPLPPAASRSRRERWESDVTWSRDHLLPWLGRRVRRTSSGASRVPKQPRYRVVAPAGAIAP
ncbi:MAG: SGNH/GDSL hydrolase family protein [Propionicimonas sp.]|nr:SGNH/GDSL hydrolase family protein [Propionicimonas sp.]